MPHSGLIEFGSVAVSLNLESEDFYLHMKNGYALDDAARAHEFIDKLGFAVDDDMDPLADPERLSWYLVVKPEIFHDPDGKLLEPADADRAYYAHIDRVKESLWV